MAKYKHLFFDLDRTLWDFESNSSRTLKHLYEEFNLKAEGVSTFEEFLAQYRLINEKLWGWYRLGNISKNDLRQKRFSETLQFFGCGDTSLGSRLDQFYIKMSPFQTTLMPHALETLEYLSSKYVMHIITNGFEEVQAIKIRESGLQPFFKHVISSERAKARKPDPVVFHLACKLAETSPDASIMIGDDLNTDIEGACTVLMDNVYYNPEGKKHHREDITYEIQHLNQLRNIL